MAFITKINKLPLGEFSISFSIRWGRFEIKPPAGIEVTYSGQVLETWEDVIEELDFIKNTYLQEKLFLRQVIIIQLRTSESTFNLIKRKFYINPNDPEKTESVRTDDYLTSAEGFELRWYIADEYRYPNQNHLYYKITESNKNNSKKRKFDKANILPQLISSSDGEFRVLDYREDLHEFLKGLDIKISQMLQQMIKYFDIDNQKFIQNFELSKFKLIGDINNEVT